MNRSKRLLAGAGVIVLATVGVQLLAQVAASAHTTGFSGNAVCQPDGSYLITWSGHTDQVPEHDLGTVNETAPASAVITTTLAPNADYGFTSTAPGTATSQSAGVHLVWRPDGSGQGDNFSADASASVTLDGNCTAPVPVPGAPSASTPTCNTDGVLTIAPSGDHVTVTQTPSGSGPGDYMITYTTAPGFTFVGGGTSKTYEITVKGKGDGLDCTTHVHITTAPSATTSTCDTAGHLVVPAQDGVTWSGGQDGDGPGTYHLVATAAPGFTLDGTKSFDVTVLPAGSGLDCRTVVVPVNPDVVQSVCTAPGQHSLPTVTPVATDGIVYTVSQDLSTVTATAVQGDKFGNLPDGWHPVSDTVATYAVSLAPAGDCTVQTRPVAPGLTQAVCKAATGVLTPPTVTLVPVKGIDYAESGEVDNGGTVTVLAQPQSGYVLVAGGGFTLNRDGTATLVVKLASVKCVKPTPPPVPPKKHHLVPPPHTNPPPPLAVTGAGTGAMLGWAAFLAVAGLFMVVMGTTRRNPHPGRLTQ